MFNLYICQLPVIDNKVYNECVKSVVLIKLQDL